MSDLVAIVMTTLHLTAANVAVGGPFIALWLYRRYGRSGDVGANLAGQRLLRASLVMMYFAAAAGVAAAFVWWNSAPLPVERAFRALPRSRYEFGVAEFVISAVCYEIWLRMWRSGSPRRRTAWWIGLFGATNVAYHFPTLFTMLSVLSTRSLADGETFRFVALLGDAEVLTRTAHFLLASAAVSATVMMWFASDGVSAQSERLQTIAARISLICTVLQWPVGIGVLFTLPETSRDMLLGGETLTAALFGVSLAAVVGLMHALAVPAFAAAGRREVRMALVWLGVTVALMTAVRQYARKPFYPTTAEATQVQAVARLPSFLSE